MVEIYLKKATKGLLAGGGNFLYLFTISSLPFTAKPPVEAKGSPSIHQGYVR